MFEGSLYANRSIAMSEFSVLGISTPDFYAMLACSMNKGKDIMSVSPLGPAALIQLDTLN